jgi:hypothetical protein
MQLKQHTIGLRAGVIFILRKEIVSLLTNHNTQDICVNFAWLTRESTHVLADSNVIPDIN